MSLLQTKNGYQVLVMVCQQGICRFVCISVFVGVAESNKNEKTARLVLLRSVLGAFFVKMPLFLGLRRMPEIYSHFCFSPFFPNWGMRCQ